MKDTFEIWLLELVEQLKALCIPEGGFTRNHPKNGLSGVVSEKAIDTLAYAAIGNIKAFRNAVLRILTDELAETNQDMGRLILEETMITRIFRPGRWRYIQRQKAALIRYRAKLQDLHYKMRELSGDNLRVALEQQKIAKG